MATTRSKLKLNKTSEQLKEAPAVEKNRLQKTNNLASSTITSKKRRVKEKKTENSSNIDQNGMMSLDVLAQVASDTLQQEPKRKSPKKSPLHTQSNGRNQVNERAKKVVTKRSLRTMEQIDLETLQMLSDKCLISFFSEMTANEITKNFTYTCYLVPGKCSQNFKSFGNENQAKSRMLDHLHKHIKKLIEWQKDPHNENKEPFFAEPVHIRNKRLAEMAGLKSKKQSLKTSNEAKKRFTALKKLDDKKSKNVQDKDQSGVESSQEEFSDVDEKQLLSNDNVVTTIKRPAFKGSKLRKKLSMQNNQGSDEDLDTEKRIEENEQFIIDLLSRTQPHQDHSYTSIFGKKKGIEFIAHDDQAEEVFTEPTDFDLYPGKIVIKPKHNREPILCLGNVSVMDELTGPGNDEASKTIIVCSEEIVDDRDIPETNMLEVGHDGERPYPPMPKFALARKGRLPVPEENEPLSEEEEPLMQPSKRNKKKGSLESGLDWERRIALKCIRELKAKKRDEKGTLFCKICRGKTFTASATLMYHYRSHAGIKPFVCLICNTTFTRQHSLNYHMLIHNNQSRFTCKDCGRKFRHPSHFKEHLRRHTGETPFVCSDCPQKFKTRNTYKRHLSTRHGKLLTASGIRVLSIEEFAKVRTKSYNYRRCPKNDHLVYENDFQGDRDLHMVNSLLDQAPDRTDILHMQNVKLEQETDSEKTDTDDGEYDEVCVDDCSLNGNEGTSVDTSALNASYTGIVID